MKQEKQTTLNHEMQNLRAEIIGLLTVSDADSVRQSLDVLRSAIRWLRSGDGCGRITLTAHAGAFSDSIRVEQTLSAPEEEIGCHISQRHIHIVQRSHAA